MGLRHLNSFKTFLCNKNKESSGESIIKAESLKEWALINIKNKDLFYGKIDTIDQKKDSIVVKEKDGKEILYKVILEIKDAKSIIDEAKGGKELTIVTLNSTQNFDILLENWKGFSECKGLSFWFCNPESSTEKKWIVKPYFHSQVTEEEALEKGMRAISENVELVG